jgi:hypothetical protein
MSDTLVQMTEQFQCPGCSAGLNPQSGCYRPDGFGCGLHSAGTFATGVGCYNLGLPTGFNRNGPVDKRLQHSIIRLYEKMPEDIFDKFNVPVWAMEQDGYLFVRTFSPRINLTWVDVIQGATLNDIPSEFHVINVAEFIDEIN